MFLEKIYLSNFKNYEEASYNFSPQVNCIVGENGSGKTNLLDSIYFLALSKSSIHHQDAHNINHYAEFMLIDGVFKKNNRTHQITCSIQRGQRKILMHEKKPYERISDHIGQFPVVLIAPDDTELIKEGSDERRRFFDGVLSQMDNEYLNDYQQYNRILEQRNSLLKIFADRNFIDQDLLDTYSDPLVKLALRIYKQRRNFVDTFLPIFKKHYAIISDGREEVEIIYESEVASGEFLQEFRLNRQTDVRAQRTTKGIHKDDYIFEIDTYPIKKFGSQGQQKSFVMALRLAQFEMIETLRETKPILLLDDIFDKLDDRRIHSLVESINNHTFGQVFITDARPERTQKILEEVTAEVKYFTITPEHKTINS
ncbi:DNA replication/repair protein RecF [Emticicia sp. C21]|uniref:DNA replication/repair protein RecF n=1 Tax=Emticicia sp. C21 TaxID=2302915 RepID=UPI000E354134|nr:DNA replication and repair protein RecF [Emticicia sp. C21]RFS15851.1 DNA replication and repair protein RecF [Emticicia sp. C21]